MPRKSVAGPCVIGRGSEPGQFTSSACNRVSYELLAASVHCGTQLALSEHYGARVDLRFSRRPQSTIAVIGCRRSGSSWLPGTPRDSDLEAGRPMDLRNRLVHFRIRDVLEPEPAELLM